MTASYANNLPDKIFLLGGKYDDFNVFKNSIKKGFSIICHRIPQTTNALTKV